MSLGLISTPTVMRLVPRSLGWDTRPGPVRVEVKGNEKTSLDPGRVGQGESGRERTATRGRVEDEGSREEELIRTVLSQTRNSFL